MNQLAIKYVSNKNGEPTDVIIPIKFWLEIESEKETAYLLKSKHMKKRLLLAKKRKNGISFKRACERLGI